MRAQLLALIERLRRLMAQADRLLTRLAEGLEFGLLVEERLRYALDHVRKVPLGTYTLATGVRVCVRHPHGGYDPLTLQEIFRDGEYAMSAEVRDRVVAHGGHIIDLGGNIGAAALWFSEAFPGQHVKCYEPDPTNAEVLRRCAEVNGRDWEIFEVAAANYDGEVRFCAGLEWASCASPDGDLVVRAVDIFRELTEAALLKIDIEGGEWAILTDPRLRQLTVPAVVVEYHPYLCPEPEAAGDLAQEALEAAGYEVRQSPKGEPGKGIIWAVRPEPSWVSARGSKDLGHASAAQASTT